jgi:outer membrane protein TolC
MEARQSLSQAERQASLARARLTQLVGEPRTALAAGPTAHGALVGSLAEAKTQALVHRIEVKQVTSKVTQAERAVDLAWSKLVPTVNLVAQAQFSRPSAFSQDAVAFVGVTFDWMAWDWGATSNGIDEARAHVRAARAGLRQLEDGIQLEVESAWVDLAAAEDQQKLAAEAARVAGENYALVQKRFGAKAATSFDLVEAESALTKARLDEKLAHVNGLMARARLARAIGKTATEIAREGTP